MLQVAPLVHYLALSMALPATVATDWRLGDGQARAMQRRAVLQGFDGLNQPSERQVWLLHEE